MSEPVDDSLPDKMSEDLQQTTFLQVGGVQLQVEDHHGHGVLLIVHHHTIGPEWQQYLRLLLFRLLKPSGTNNDILATY